MQEEGLKPTTTCLNAAIGACVKGGEPQRAVQLFDALAAICKPDASTFNALVRVHCLVSPPRLRWPTSLTLPSLLYACHARTATNTPARAHPPHPPPLPSPRQLGKFREAQGMLDMMIRGGQHVEAATYASHIEAAWSTGVLPLQAYALRLYERAVARHSLAAAAVEDEPGSPGGAGGVTRLVLPAAPPYVSLIALVQLLRTLRQRAAAGGAAGVRGAVQLSAAVHDEARMLTEQVLWGVLCALGCPLQPVAPLAQAAPSPSSPGLLGGGVALDAAAALDPAAGSAGGSGSAASGSASGAPSSGGASPKGPTPPPAAIEMACDGAAFADWLAGPALGASLGALLPDEAAAAGGSGPLQLLSVQLPDGQALAGDDAAREARCGMAMQAVQRIEATAGVDVQVRARALCLLDARAPSPAPAPPPPPGAMDPGRQAPQLTPPPHPAPAPPPPAGPAGRLPPAAR
jgi:hypothetical protein